MLLSSVPKMKPIDDSAANPCTLSKTNNSLESSQSILKKDLQGKYIIFIKQQMFLSKNGLWKHKGQMQYTTSGF